MSRPAHHKLDIYGTELHLAWDTRTWAALRRMNPDLDLAKDLGYGQTSDSRHRDNDQQHIWIYIGLRLHAGADPHELIDTVAHEAAHVAHAITHRHGITLETSNGEPFAYLTGWLTGWIWRNLPDTARGIAA